MRMTGDLAGFFLDGGEHWLSLMHPPLRYRGAHSRIVRHGYSTLYRTGSESRGYTELTLLTVNPNDLRISLP